ncbi:large ribosomal subunit protein uL10m isoform X1 [Ammospiza caudacuta]|uniref:large ribosomal subunit protein uL10m isoform X1 n=1 Tax=Ammospiza caudacuta TaxID=2857398 RepID=UPI002739EE99|nr:large ribosomal subunit protein uL10m isoform X1 [Ammospiza caudacuta]
MAALSGGGTRWRRGWLPALQLLRHGSKAVTRHWKAMHFQRQKLLALTEYLPPRPALPPRCLPRPAPRQQQEDGYARVLRAQLEATLRASRMVAVCQYNAMADEDVAALRHFLRRHDIHVKFVLNEEHPAGEPGAAGQGDAESAQGGAPGHPAGRLHRRHHPEPAGRGERGAAAAAGGVPGPDGGGAVRAALADLLPAPARPRAPGGAPGAARPAAAGRGRGRGACPGPGETVTPGTGNRLLPWPRETGSPPDGGLEGHGHNPHGILQLHGELGRGVWH